MRRVQSGVVSSVQVARVGRLRCVSVSSELELQLASSPAFAFESAYALYQSRELRRSRELPRSALAPALLGLRRAAEARKSRRIARRFAALGGVNRTKAFGQDEGADWALFE
jgi:hypothetical protein